VSREEDARNSASAKAIIVYLELAKSATGGATTRGIQVREYGRSVFLFFSLSEMDRFRTLFSFFHDGQLQMQQLANAG
jgi:hypothetical protein